MSSLIYICSLLISVNTLPDPLISSYYQHYYQCPLRMLSEPTTATPSSIYQIPVQFLSEKRLWPVFTIDQIQSKNFKEMMAQGIKPGLLIPENFMNPVIYFQIKKQINSGAIPLLSLDTVQPLRFNNLATLATSVGLRPMGAYVQNGWNPLLKALPKGLYIVQANEGQIPLPSYAIKSQQHMFYTAYVNPQEFMGTGIVLNPQGNIAKEDIHYPELGISWTLFNIPFNSQTDQIHTSVLGYLLLVAGLLILPLYLILSLHYPELLRFWGASTSWISVFVIIILMIILAITMLWRGFKK